MRVNGTANTISQNVISSIYGAGVLVQPSASNNTITQNSIFGNGTVVSANGTAASGQLGIDCAHWWQYQHRRRAPVSTNDNGDGGHWRQRPD